MSNQLARGAVFLLLGELCLAIMAAFIKHLSGQVSHETMVFARNLFGLIALLPILGRFGVADLKTQQFPMHLLRTLSGLSAMYGYFYVIAHMPLAEAVLVKLSAPFFLPLIAFIWLKERISLITLWSIVLGFIGVIFVLRPGSESFQPVALVGIAAAVLASVAKVCIRRMAPSEPSHRIVFYFGLLATAISAIPAFWHWQPPTNHGAWLWLAAIGLAGTCGQLLMTQAYLVAKPGQVGPYTYSSVVYASIMGWIFWQEALIWTTVVGCILIIAAGIINMRKAN